MRNSMRLKAISFVLIGLFTGLAMAQEEAVNKAMEKDDSKDLKPGDIAPSWALMYDLGSKPAKYEFLKTWANEEGQRLRLMVSQPDRHAVLMSFFATWCQPCMKELPLLEEVYQEYKDERIKFFLVDITEATRTIPGNENLPKAGPFLQKKGMTMQILYDTRGTVMKRYNAQTLPRLFIMDGNRKITLTRRGFHAGEEEKFKNDMSNEIERLLADLPPPKSETK